jgi:tyrosine-protein phosphatase YwqE
MFSFCFKKRERLPLPYQRELHCHIIPGVDDGSRKKEDSLFYLESLASFGVQQVVFTPHCIEERFENTPTIIEPIFQDLAHSVQQKHGLDLSLSYSFEYRLDPGFLKLLEQSNFGVEGCQLRPLYGKYLLIENSFAQQVPGMDRVVAEIQQRGFYPILAHPERYIYYAGHKGQYYHQLQNHQVEFQCNLLSFAGYYGDVAKKMAYWMLEQGYVNFLGSDLHHHQHVHLISQFLKSKEYARIYPLLREQISNDRM